MNLWRPGGSERRGRTTLIRNTGWATAILSLLGLIAGLVLVETVADDYRRTASVSRSATAAIGETIASVDQIAQGTAEGLRSAGASVDRASATLDDATATLEGVAVFLEEDLPEDLESIRAAMPAAIQTANAVDGTLRALSLFGVDYDPEEPFGESLARVEEALEGLPSDLRAQSDSLRVLIPSTTSLSEDTDDLSADISQLAESLDGFTSLTGEYRETIAEAEAAIEQNGQSVGAAVWLMRVLAVIAGLAGISVGLALTSVGNALTHASPAWRHRIDDLADERVTETVD